MEGAAALPGLVLAAGEVVEAVGSVDEEGRGKT